MHLSNVSRSTRRVSATKAKRPITVRLALEHLETRLAPAIGPMVGLSFVNDNWAFIADNDTSGTLTVGDTVRNLNDTINPGGVTGVYGVDAFGTVTSGAFTGSVAGQATINNAIARTITGGNVDVLEGTYSEEVIINKTLTVKGAQAGVNAQDGRPGAAETVLDAVGNSGKTLFSVTANDVTIDGFTAQGETDPTVLGFGIVLGGATSGAHVVNNIIQNNIAGLSLANNPAGNPALIQHNLFRNNNQTGSVSGTGIYTDQFNASGTLANVTIDANTFTSNDNAAVLLGSTQAASQSNVAISNNVMTGNGNAILLFNTTTAVVYRNTITSSTASQVVFGGGVNGAQVTQNFIQNGATRGIRIGDFGGGSANSNITVNDNSISGNPTAGLEIDAAAGAYTGTLDAKNNWWGSPSGPTTPANPGGTGDAIIDPNHQVTFLPFRTNGIDAQPATPGYQPSPNSPDVVVTGTSSDDTLIVNASGPNSGTYSLNGGPAIAFSNITSFSFYGQGGNDTLILNNVSGGLFNPTNGVFYDGGPGANTLTVNAAGAPAATRPGQVLLGDPLTISYVNVNAVNINNAGAVGAIAGPDTADRATAFTGLTADERFVQALYLDELGRVGAKAELDGWVASLDGTSGARAVVAASIQHSSEARTNLVKSWYKNYLGRQAFGGEEQGWVTLLGQGQPEEQVLSQILGTQEFYNRAQTLIGSGTPDQRFAGALYQLLLKRTASAGETTNAANEVAQAGRQGTALTFLKSQEFRTYQFDGYYDALLHRPSDPAGLNGWVFSNLDVATVRVGFETGTEFYFNG